MKKALLISLLAIVAFGCNSNTKDKKIAHTITAENDTLKFRYDSVKVVSSNTVTNAYNTNVDTTNAIVRYPVFENDSLNNYIKQQVFNFYAEEDYPSAYDDIASSFVRGYNEFYLQNKGTSQWWYLLIDIKVIRQMHNYIALQYLHSDYAGGAHGNAIHSYINFDPKREVGITLDSLILPQKKNDLVKLAEEIFRKDEKLTATEPLDKKYFFTNGKFALAQNFYVSNEGLTFLYNPYEIKPYAYGTTKLVIPTALLKNFAKPNTILSTDADI